TQGKQLGIGSRWEIGNYFTCFGVDDLDRVVITHGHQAMIIVFGQLDPAWPLANFDGPNGFHLVSVHHANGVALLVRNIGRKSTRWAYKADSKCKGQETRAVFVHWYGPD